MHVDPGGEWRPRRAQGHLDLVVVAGGGAGGGEVPMLAETGVHGEEEAIRLRQEEVVLRILRGIHEQRRRLGEGRKQGGHCELFFLDV